MGHVDMEDRIPKGSKYFRNFFLNFVEYYFDLLILIPKYYL
jgi:hypothetical protein